MPLSVNIIDGGGTGRIARVLDGGALSIGSDYDLTEFRELDSPATAFNFYIPSPGARLVVTGMRVKANRSVSNTIDAEIVIYESGGIDSTTVDKTIHQEALVRGEGSVLFPLNILTSEGVFINAKTSDASVFITILGHYIEI